MGEYQCEARNVNAFVRQVVRYVSSGHYFYVRCLMKDRPNQLSPEEVDRLVIDKYEIARKRWQRKKRYLKDKAGIHYIRYGRLYVIMLSKGKHERFYSDHGKNVQNIQRKALIVFSYKIRFSFSQKEKRRKVFVRLSDDELARLTQHMLTICIWDRFRDPVTLEKEFSNLPYDSYDPVFRQLIALGRKVNRLRKKRGFDQINLSCIKPFVSVQTVYFEVESDEAIRT